MSGLSTPNLGMDLLRIHSILTRGLRVAIEHSQAFAKQGNPGMTTREGFINYVWSYASVLDAHHHLEDQLAFPYFRERFPDAPYDLLTAQHRNLVPILDRVKFTIDEMPAQAEGREAWDKLHLLLRGIDELWHPHIRIEEENFTVDKVGAGIAPEEHVRLAKLFMEHNQQHSGPDFLVVPFLLYNLPLEQRSTFADLMPPIVTEQLVPVVWKAKWEPMKPFLLP